MKKNLVKVLIGLICLCVVFFLVLLFTNKKEEPYNEEPQQEVVEETKQEKPEVKEEEKLIVAEEKEEIKEETPNLTELDYWVVFYDQYGNELQREALKYGTIPEYKSWLPEGFDNWIYKRSGIKVEEFLPIDGNTYFQAVCHEVHHEVHHESNDTSNTPPTPSVSYTTIWEGNIATGDYANAMNDIAWTYDWSTVTVGTILHIEFTTEYDTGGNNEHKIRLCDGMWVPLESAKVLSGSDMADFDVNENDTVFEITINQDMLDELQDPNRGGIVLYGKWVVYSALKLGVSE